VDREPEQTDIVRDILQRDHWNWMWCLVLRAAVAFQQAMKLCKPMGRIVIVGIPETDQSSFPAHDARRKGLTFINVRRQNAGIGPVISRIKEGRIRPDFMITHRFSLDRAARAFELLADYRDGILKAIIDGHSTDRRITDAISGD
jgi:threonine dehydrogenase-like Zn-dependent dehydrogenase